MINGESAEDEALFSRQVQDARTTHRRLSVTRFECRCFPHTAITNTTYMLTHHRSKSRRCGSTACAPCHCTGLEYTRCSPESCSGVAVALLARTWTEDGNGTAFSGPYPLRYRRTDTTGSGGMLQPDTKQGKCHDKDKPV